MPYDPGGHFENALWLSYWRDHVPTPVYRQTNAPVSESVIQASLSDWNSYAPAWGGPFFSYAGATSSEWVDGAIVIQLETRPDPPPPAPPFPCGFVPHYPAALHGIRLQVPIKYCPLIPPLQQPVAFGWTVRFRSAQIRLMIDCGYPPQGVIAHEWATP